MKAILTKWLGPTDTKGTRIKAYDSDGNSVTIPIDYGLEDSDNDRAACLALIERLDWNCSILGSGYIKGGRCFVLKIGKE